MGSCFMSFLVLGLIFLCQMSSLYAANGIPLVIWSDIPPNPNERNPFKNTSPEELCQIINGTLGSLQPPLVVFVKDDLCVEDITRSSKNLQSLKASSMQYIPATESPLSIFKDFPNYNETTDDEIDSVMLDRQITIKSINELSNLPESYDIVKQSNPNAVVVLTGKTCRYSHRERTRRAATADVTASNENVTELIIRPGDAKNEKRILYVSQYPSYQMPEMNSMVTMSNVKASSSGKGTVKDPLLLSFDETIPNASDLHRVVVDFKFLIKPAGYYTLNRVEFKKNNIVSTYLTPSVDISFPFNFSYHCSQNIVFTNGSVTVVIKDLQVQIEAASEEFNDAYDCIGFTTIPIWMGIFVTAILALIMMWGLTMIIDIRTMDRFDDPKGKTITISAQE